MEVRLNPAVEGMPPYPMSELAATARRLREQGHAVFDFGIGDPLDPTPDFIRRALVEAVPDVSQYPTAVGQPQLRRAAAGWLRRRLGVAVDPDTEVLPTSGSKEAIFHLPLLVIDPASRRRGVLFGEPGYPVYERGGALAGAEPMALPLTSDTGFLLDPAALPKSDAERVALVWVNYPHNPTGAVADLEDHRRLLAWCREREVVLCSDECYIDTYYGDGAPPSLLQVAGDDRSGVLGFFSCSKRSGMTGYRSGFVAGDARLITAYAKLRASIGTASQDFVQHAAIAAWSDDRHAAHRRKLFTAKREVFDRLFEEIGVEVAGSRATFYLWLRTPAGMTGDKYCLRLLDAGIIATPGASFGPAGEGYVRLALAPPLDHCELAARAWRSLEA